MSLTVHMVANAHLDPVWLWPWQAGADEAIATCRSACDFLDEYPELRFSRGEAWVYKQVRSLDPDLFERIRRHMAAGRWEVVNGWWVQPDLNTPSETGSLRCAQVGHAWFREHLGLRDIPVAWNVDSFGHGAYLPRVIRNAGQRYYVMMRPGPPEMDIPSCLFRWRSPDGVEVLTFRLMWTYVASTPDAGGQGMDIHVKLAVEAAPAGVGHMMCLYGIGDHGGGPSRALIDWIVRHRDYAPGVRLEFSTAGRFFEAVEPFRAQLPVVSGELQYHAVGCYSVCGGLKRDYRAAELAVEDAETLMTRAGADTPADGAGEIQEAWKGVSFTQFHDVLPGSAIPEGIDAARREVGASRVRAEKLTHRLLRRHLAYGPRCPLQGQRIHVVNRLARPWSGWVETEPWFDWKPWDNHLEDADGRPVPVQRTHAASLVMVEAATAVPRLLFPASLPAGGALAFRVVPGVHAPGDLAATAPRMADRTLENGVVRVHLGRGGIERVTQMMDGREWLAGPVEIQCLEDLSDTWSHDIDRYGGRVLAAAGFESPVVVEEGIWRTTVRLDGHIGASPCRLFVALCRGEAVVRARLLVNYGEPMTVVKALIRPAGGVRERRDRVAGGWIERPLNGREYPLHHAVCCAGTGLVLPDSFAVDATDDAIRPTLLRDSYHALYYSGLAKGEKPPQVADRPGTDDGPASLRLLLAFGEWGSPERLDALLDGEQRPPYTWDDYRGLSRVFRYEGGV